MSQAHALDNVSFTLPARGRFALVGDNGSGKSSLIRVLLGLQHGYPAMPTPSWCSIRAGSWASARTRCCSVIAGRMPHCGRTILAPWRVSLPKRRLKSRHHPCRAPSQSSTAP